VTLLMAVISGRSGHPFTDRTSRTPRMSVTPGILIALYVVATCGSCLVASNRWLVLLGLANLSAVIALGWITFSGFTSLWCAWGH
jgi:hypothetical protein